MEGKPTEDGRTVMESSPTRPDFLAYLSHMRHRIGSGLGPRTAGG
jgi:hypothetical protein